MKRLMMLLIVLLAACERNSGLDPLVPQHDFSEDVTPPQIVSFTFSPTSVDASAASVPLTVRVGFTDDLSGIGFCAFTMRSPSGAQQISELLNPGQLVEGTPLAGVLETTILVPRYSESGTWTVQYIFCRDVVTNGIQYNDGNPSPFPSPTFTVTSEGDIEPPVIASASFTPALVDASLGAVALTFSITFTDNLAGLEFCSTSFRSPSGMQTINYLMNVNGGLASGTTVSGVISGTEYLPQFSESGVWTPVYIYCRDAARNGVQYDVGNPLDPQPQFEVSSPADVTPPTITGVTIAPAVVDVSEGPANMTLRIAFTDAAAGIGFCSAVWLSPSQQQWISWLGNPAEHLTSGTVNDGVLQVTSALPQYSEAGEWTIQYIFCRDAATNGIQYNAFDPLPSGAPTFVVAETNPCVLIERLIAASPIRSLAAKAEAALASCERGQPHVAANQLRAYGNELAALLKTERISNAVAADLNARVARILELLTP